jgi:hypothetical protein
VGDQRSAVASMERARRLNGSRSSAGKFALLALAALAIAAVALPASPAAAAGCPNEGLRSEANSLGLPDCRAYELVSPAIKDFAFGENGGFAQIAVGSEEGNAAAFNTEGPMPGAVSGELQNPNVSRRGANGWVSKAIAPPEHPRGGAGQFPYVLGYSKDLSHFFFLSENPPLAPGAQENVLNLYGGDTETGAVSLVSTDAGGGFLVFATMEGVSSDSSRFFFETLEPLVPGDVPPTATRVYEWSEGTLHQVGILPDGTTASTSLIGGGGGNYRVEHAISEDGSRAIFVAPSSAGTFEIYERIDGTSTVEVSESKRAVPVSNEEKKGSQFWGASSDGNTVLFTSPVALTEDATTGENGSGEPTSAGNDLYSYDVATDTLTDLTVDNDAADATTGANVQGVIGNSDDGRTVYFVATGKLAEGATSGQLNLYVADGSEVEYIGALDPADNFDWGRFQAGPEGVTARVSASGALAFQSVAPLTGYDNVDPTTGVPTSQVYLYSAGELTCASCRPDGSPPAGNSTIEPADYAANLTRNLSDDGSRLFFDSTDAIVPADTNGKSDVYEWTGGAVHLISDGASPFESLFQDASADGGNVFFSSAARLVGQDIDRHRDIYDARVDGGFPAPPVTPPGCVGEGCRTGTSTKPSDQAAATVGFQGPPNPKPAKHKKHKHKKHKHKKRHAKKHKKAHGQKRSANKSGRGK